MLEKPIHNDWEGFLACVQRTGTPRRVFFAELFLDAEVQTAVAQQFGLLEGLQTGDPYFREKRMVRIQRFLGYDYVRQWLEGMDMIFNRNAIQDTAPLQRETGRSFMNENIGPITNWEEFEKYPWPDPALASTRALEWYEKNLPDDMCVIASGSFSQFNEYMTWLMGYQNLCYALYDNRDLVQAISDRLISISVAALERILEFKRVKLVWGMDDMGFKTGTLISPNDLRQFVLPGHKKMAEMAHAAHMPYLLHSCGQLTSIMPDLIENVHIDARHSFEDTIENVILVKQKYGDRITLLGGIDVDFMCRSSQEEVRTRVKKTLDVCLPGGGYCLGTGNSVANYIPLENYFAMLDEGRRYKL